MLMSSWKMCLVFVMALALAGCTTDRTFGTAPDIEVTSLTSLPSPVNVDGFQFTGLDSVEIRVLQDSSLNGTYFLDASGQLPFPLIGMVDAEGLSPVQLAIRIRTRLADGYIVNPEVIVRPTEMRQFSVSFGGQIKKPGSYTASDVPTLLRGVNVAGGLTEYAESEDVLVMRTVGEQNYIGVYNLAAISRGNYADPSLYPGDIIMIGDSPSRRRLERLLPFISAFTSTAILLERVLK